MGHSVIDMIGREVKFTGTPCRIISLVPSQTELLHYLGLEEHVVGITRFCNRPEHWSSFKSIIGGTKTIDIGKIKRLSPDLIIGNKEENVEEQINMLQDRYPVWISDVNNMEDATRMITEIGALVDRKQKADDLVSRIEEKFKRLRDSLKNRPSPTAAYVIWKSPYMVSGRDTFIDHLLNVCGIRNCFADKSRYPTVTAEDLNERKPDFIFFSSEPFPFDEKRVAEEQHAFANSECMLVDGEYFSWYGSRLLHAPDYLSIVLEKIHEKSIR